MEYSTGKISFIVLVAVGLASLASVLLAWRFRVAMRSLMSAQAVSGGAAADAVTLPTLGPPAPVTLADNRTAARRVTAGLIGLSLLMSFSSAALELSVVLDSPVTPNRLLVLALVHTWPVVPALGLLYRWSRWRVAGLLVLWFVLSVLVVAWRSTEKQTLSLIFTYLGLEIGPPLLLITLLCLGNATRAIAPWLLPPFVVLVWASIVGMDVLTVLAQDESPVLKALPESLGAETVIMAFIALPWLLAWWPVKWLARGIAKAHEAKHITELSLLFASVWGISQIYKAIGAGSSLGLGGTVMLLPLLWLPAVAWWLRRRAASAAGSGRPPTLLVLRVFQRDAHVQRLFDDVVERWRLTGNTVLIAGTDLVERTLDAEDLFGFLAGRLRERFVLSPQEVGHRLAAFDMVRDFDGRFRVNECYCHDSTWQQALAALVDRSDVVLMDLRSFQARHQGCRHELGVLAQAAGAKRVVLLTDAQTDQAAASEAAAGAPGGRFVWIDASRVDSRKRREVLASLFA